MYERCALRLSRTVNVSTITPSQFLESVLVKVISRKLTGCRIGCYAFAKLHPVQTERWLLHQYANSFSELTLWSFL
jgi:hypothetical protein